MDGTYNTPYNANTKAKRIQSDALLSVLSMISLEFLDASEGQRM